MSLLVQVEALARGKRSLSEEVVRLTVKCEELGAQAVALNQMQGAETERRSREELLLELLGEKEEVSGRL